MSMATKKCCCIFLSLCILVLISIFLPAPSTAGEIAECLSCHGDRDLEDESGKSLHVNKISFLNSAHGENFTCSDCHTDFADLEEAIHDQEINKPNCASCHREEGEEYSKSIHARLKESGDEEAPGCTSCHEKHYILSPADSNSPLYRTNQVKICARCHENVRLMEERGKSDLAEFVRSYEESIHGVGVSKAGLRVSAVCSDCHQSHKIVQVTKTSSPAWRRNIPKTCSKCHIGVYKTYKKSVHGQSFFKGDQDSPVCTDCHGEHTIQRPGEESASIYTTHIPETCSHCHDDMALDNKYDLPAKRLTSFLGSYHGIALSLGDVRVANCASCHGYHNILPSSDPESMIHPSNLQATCGSCHPDAGRNFAKAKIHLTDTNDQNIGVLIVKRFYTALIAALMLTFVSLIVLDLLGHVNRRKRAAEES